MAVYYPDFNSFRRAQRSALDKTSSYEAVMRRLGQSQAAQKMTEVTNNPNQITTLNGEQNLTTFSGSPLLKIGA
jgi:23S rRNA A2030 N6-methylase RlmJ